MVGSAIETAVLLLIWKASQAGGHQWLAGSEH